MSYTTRNKINYNNGYLASLNEYIEQIRFDNIRYNYGFTDEQMITIAEYMKSVARKNY